MKRLNPNLLIVTTLACITVVLSVWIYTKDRPVPVQPIEPVARDFATLVREAVDGKSAAERADLAQHFRLRIAVIDKVDFENTLKMLAVFTRAHEFNEVLGGGAGDTKLSNLVVQEAQRRGLLADDEDDDGLTDKPLPVDRDQWKQLFCDVMKAVR